MVALTAVIGLVVALAALAWWWSGRSRGADHNPLTAGERAEAEVKTMKQYRPNGGNPPGPLI